MDCKTYLDRMIIKYEKTFDIQQPYSIDGKEYPAYGYFFSESEKYVLTQKANLWSVHTFEHILFLTADPCREETLEEARRIIDSYMEPHLVRKDRKVPPKDHMVSYLTIAILTEHTPGREVIQKAEAFRYDRSYLLTIRGASEGHLILVDLEGEEVYSNRRARNLREIYRKGFSA